MIVSLPLIITDKLCLSLLCKDIEMNSPTTVHYYIDGICSESGKVYRLYSGVRTSNLEFMKESLVRYREAYPGENLFLSKETVTTKTEKLEF